VSAIAPLANKKFDCLTSANELQSLQLYDKSNGTFSFTVANAITGTWEPAFKAKTEIWGSSSEDMCNIIGCSL
jgi:hypothetical protein